ncbi:adenosylcobinamide-phosphate synthase [Sporanaerobium hydrogeniformans]|uniref:Adenosylcobinamide-phosphate synthase n=1 Tax=Sporanaerobium hydrogeniformans TaxID=3072179 RepID=A0AC61DCN1_9FIRM|nr:adenosylcobinamide-phosphate synthase CbiB [Sporanaerobium hydrogeniformans]PHV70995.1 adenosylcobinamide-phosphate synthase [Sporanaerobium hydrogeniformans]
MSILSFVLGYVLDLILGDPYNFPHPVRLIGKLVRKVETLIRRRVTSSKGLQIGGGVLWLVVVGTTFITSYGLIQISRVHPILYGIVSTYLIYTTLATKCLGQEAYKIYQVLNTKSLEEARVQLSYIVGRDTQSLSEEEVIKATVETVAENTVDGVIAPLFYAFIGGAPLALAYKAVNTLDSMVGYKNEKYKDLGMVSARIDDAANFIPARLTALLMSMACGLLRLKGRQALSIAIRDRKNHKSPNCAYPEGAVAGALGIQLGGTHTYFGEEVYKPTIGDALRKINKEDILKTNAILYTTSGLSFILFMCMYLLVVK